MCESVQQKLGHTTIYWCKSGAVKEDWDFGSSFFGRYLGNVRANNSFLNLFSGSFPKLLRNLKISLFSPTNWCIELFVLTLWFIGHWRPLLVCRSHITKHLTMKCKIFLYLYKSWFKTNFKWKKQNVWSSCGKFSMKTKFIMYILGRIQRNSGSVTWP